MHPISDVVNHFVEVTDVDGIIRRIDVDSVVERIDINKLVNRIDLNQVLTKIDWNAQLSRVDLDQVLSNVDTNALIARSSTGIFSSFLDAMRFQITMMDLYLRIVTRCRLWRQDHRERIYLPPRPGRHRQRNDRELYPKGRTNKAVAVQGRYCGFVSKAVAILGDIFFITVLFAMIFQVVQWCLILFLGISHDEAENKTRDFQRQGNLAMVMMYCGFWFMYFFLSVALAGQTIGMAIVGLKVCNCNSSPHSTVSVKQTFIRTCLLPLSVTLCPPLGVIGLVRGDGRMLHDLVANTGMVYLWNAKLAKMRNQALREEQAGSVLSDDDASDELDEIIGDEQYDHDEDGESSFRYQNGSSMQGQEVLLRRNVVSSRYSTFNTSDTGGSTGTAGDQDAEAQRPGCCHMV